MSRDARHYTAEDMREQGLRYAQFLTAIIETERKNAMSEQPDTVDFVREWLMSSDHPISDWEREFAAAIDARNASPAADIETKPLAEEATAKPRMFFGQSNRFDEPPKAAPMREHPAAPQGEGVDANGSMTAPVERAKYEELERDFAAIRKDYGAAAYLIVKMRERWTAVSDQLGHIEGGMFAGLEDAASAMASICDNPRAALAAAAIASGREGAE